MTRQIIRRVPNELKSVSKVAIVVRCAFGPIHDGLEEIFDGDVKTWVREWKPRHCVVCREGCETGIIGNTRVLLVRLAQYSIHPLNREHRVRRCSPPLSLSLSNSSHYFQYTRRSRRPTDVLQVDLGLRPNEHGHWCCSLLRGFDDGGTNPKYTTREALNSCTAY